MPQHEFLHKLLVVLALIANKMGLQKMWDLWWKKWHWGRFFPNISFSRANSHSTKRPMPFYPGAGAIGQLLADLPSGLNVTPPIEIKYVYIYLYVYS
jgi:hypothetical protein